MIKDVDMRLKSENFFNFFQQIIGDVQKSMPVIKEPKKQKEKKEEMVAAIKKNFEKKIQEKIEEKKQEDDIGLNI